MVPLQLTAWLEQEELETVIGQSIIFCSAKQGLLQVVGSHPTPLPDDTTQDGHESSLHDML